jgi:hypothetical protein
VDPNGEIFGAPLDLALAEHTVVQPDLLYLPGSRPAQNNPIDVVPEFNTAAKMARFLGFHQKKQGLSIKAHRGICFAL